MFNFNLLNSFFFVNFNFSKSTDNEPQRDLIIDSKTLSDDSKFSSILNSCENYSKLFIEEINYNDLENLLKLSVIAEKHGEDIKHLEMNDTNYLASPYKLDTKWLGDFLKNFTNLDVWEIHMPYRIGSIDGPCYQPVFSKLKRISIDHCLEDVCFKLSSFIAVDSLESLDISGSMIYFHYFLRNQSNLKAIRIESSEALKAEWFEHLKLEKFCYEYEEECEDVRNFLLQFLRQQEDLKEIDIVPQNSSELALDASIILTICLRSHSLESLKIALSDRNVESFLYIDQLNKLKKVQISFSKDFSKFDVFMKITQLKMETVRIVHFHKPEGYRFDFEVAMKNLRENWKNVEKWEVFEHGVIPGKF